MIFGKGKKQGRDTKRWVKEIGSKDEKTTKMKKTCCGVVVFIVAFVVAFVFVVLVVVLVIVPVIVLVIGCHCCGCFVVVVCPITHKDQPKRTCFPEFGCPFFLSLPFLLLFLPVSFLPSFLSLPSCFLPFCLSFLVVFLVLSCCSCCLNYKCFIYCCCYCYKTFFDVKMLVVLLFFFLGGGGSLFIVVIVVVFLCCYVVKLAKAINTNPRKSTPQKGGRTSVHFEHGQLCLHMQKFFFLVSLVFFLSFWSQTTIKIVFVFFEDSEN